MPLLLLSTLAQNTAAGVMQGVFRQALFAWPVGAAVLAPIGFAAGPLAPVVVPALGTARFVGGVAYGVVKKHVYRFMKQ